MPTCQEVYESHIGDVVLSEQQIQNRVSELGDELTRDYGDKEPLFLCSMTGSFIFAADIIRKLHFPCNVDSVNLSLYVKDQKTGTMKIDPSLIEKESVFTRMKVSPSGRHVIIIEDIIESGGTIEGIKKDLNGLPKPPASVSVMVLVDIKNRAPPGRESCDYTGFSIESDDWLIGYGVDCNQRYRNLPYIAKYKQML